MRRVLYVLIIAAWLLAPATGAAQTTFPVAEQASTWLQPRPADGFTPSHLRRHTRTVRIELDPPVCSTLHRIDVQRRAGAVVITTVYNVRQNRGAPYYIAPECPLRARSVTRVNLEGRLGSRSIKDGAVTPAAVRYTGPPAGQLIGRLPLRAVPGEQGRGALRLYALADAFAFEVTARHLAPAPRNSAYGIWLTGGGRPHFLGYAPTVGEDGRLASAGPRTGDSGRFTRWLRRARHVVLTRETRTNAQRPGARILVGDIANVQATATGRSATLAR